MVKTVNVFDDRYRGLTSPLTETVSKASTPEGFQIALLIMLAVVAITLCVVLYRRRLTVAERQSRPIGFVHFRSPA